VSSGISAAATNPPAASSKSGVASSAGPFGAVQPTGAMPNIRCAIAHIAVVVALLLLGFIIKILVITKAQLSQNPLHLPSQTHESQTFNRDIAVSHASLINIPFFRHRSICRQK